MVFLWNLLSRMHSAFVDPLTHPTYCREILLLDTDANFFFLSLSHSLAKKRRPHPADSALQVYGEVLHRSFFKAFSPPYNPVICWNIYIYFFFSFLSPSLWRTLTWPVCWVLVLLGTWRTWAWPSLMSPVPVLSSWSSCRHSNSSTSGLPRWEQFSNTHTRTHWLGQQCQSFYLF